VKPLYIIFEGTIVGWERDDKFEKMTTAGKE
jgi:hypothetical protein